MTLEFRTLTGSDVSAALDDLAHLRITVFKEWPYLYDGDLDYERRYMTSYQDNPNAILVGAFAGAQLVGAATGMGLLGHDAAFAQALEGHSADLSEIFYCAESVLLPQYRGQGAGHAFFDHRETFAREQGYRYSAFCGVIRPTDHPLAPTGYRPLDPFWHKRGYAPVENAIAHLKWRDIGNDDNTAKPLQFWMRPL